MTLDNVRLQVSSYTEEMAQTPGDYHPLRQIRVTCAPSDITMSDAFAQTLRGSQGAMLLQDDSQRLTVVRVCDYAPTAQSSNATYHLHLEEVCCGLGMGA